MPLETTTMHEAADALLEAGISLPLFALRLPFLGKREIRLRTRRPTLGGQIRLARKYLELGVSYEAMQAMTASEQAVFLATHGQTLSELVALCVATGYLTGKLLYKPLSWLIRWRAREEHLLAITLGYVRLMGTRSFWTIIGFVEGRNPLTPSHSTEGS